MDLYCWSKHQSVTTSQLQRPLIKRIPLRRKKSMWTEYALQILKTSFSILSLRMFTNIFIRFRHFFLYFTKKSIMESLKPIMVIELSLKNFSNRMREMKCAPTWIINQLMKSYKCPFYILLTSFISKGDIVFGTRWLSCHSVTVVFACHFIGTWTIGHDNIVDRTVPHDDFNGSWTVCHDSKGCEGSKGGWERCTRQFSKDLRI